MNLFGDLTNMISWNSYFIFIDATSFWFFWVYFEKRNCVREL